MGTNKKQDLAPLKFPKRPPQDIVAEYLHSYTINNMIRKYPEWDVPRSDAAAELVAKKRELFEVETRFAAKRREAVERRRMLDEMWNDLEEREETLRSNFIKFNKFVKENQEKKERGERMIAEDSMLAQKKINEIEELTLKYEFMCEIRSQMEKNIRNHHVYEDFLLACANTFPVYHSIESILDRYEALAEARKVLADRQEQDLSALEEAKARMLRLTEDSTLVLMGLHNVLSDLESRYESARNKALHWETIVSRVKNIWSNAWSSCRTSDSPYGPCIWRCVSAKKSSHFWPKTTSKINCCSSKPQSVNLRRSRRSLADVRRIQAKNNLIFIPADGIIAQK
ncbi:hypothetical protein FQR65_LT13322 [Abscondita terminalis]|nr:hypothetical protein FQR65_LT13322 [Abscondita terminalis]